MAERDRLARVPRLARLLVFAGVIAAVAVGAFVAGRAVRSDADRALAAAPSVVPVCVAVDRRVVPTASSFQGQVVPPQTSQVTLNVPGHQVVEGVSANVGDTVTAGQLLGAVSGHYVLAVPANLPLYRDLEVGSVGEDVRALNSLLVGAGHLAQAAGAGAEFSAASANAYKAWRKAAGVPTYAIGTGQPRLADLATVPAAGHVATVASVGATLTDSRPLLTVEVGSATVSLVVDPASASAFTPGSSAVLRSQVGSWKGKVLTLGPFQPPSESAPGGHLVVIDPIIDSGPPLAGGLPVAVSLGDDGEPLLAVPAVAVRQDSAGTYVLTCEGGERRPVTVLRSRDGWTGVAAELLTSGQMVLVS